MPERLAKIHRCAGLWFGLAALTAAPAQEATGPDAVTAAPGAAVPDAGAEDLAGVTAIAIEGVVSDSGDVAKLTLTFDLWARGPGPRAVPIGLNGLYPREAEANGQPIAWTNDPPGHWNLVLPGPGNWTSEVEVLCKVQSLDKRRGLALEIPPTPRARLSLELPYRAVEATAGEDDTPLPEPIPLAKGQRSRIETLLPITPRVEVSWLPELQKVEPPAPLMIASGDVSLRIGADQLTSQTTWRVQGLRGEATSLTLLVDRRDEIQDVSVGDRYVEPKRAAAGPTERDRPLIRHRIELPEPLTAGDSETVQLVTRRRIEAFPEGARVRVRPPAILGLVEQSGTLAVSQPEETWLEFEPSPGLRRVDPRKLNTSVSREAVSAAFRFESREAELGIQVHPIPAQETAATRSALELRADSVSVRTWVDYRVTRGRIFSCAIHVPDGLVVERLGPARQVKHQTTVPDDDGLLHVELREPRSAGDVFRLELTGRIERSEGSEGAEELRLPLFEPRGVTFDEGTLAIVPSEAERPRRVVSESGFEPIARPAGAGPWSRLGEDPNHSVLWLRQLRRGGPLCVIVEPRDRSAHREESLLVRVGFEGVDVQQDFTLFFADPSVGAVELAIPPELIGSWKLSERPEGSSIQSLAPGPGGEPRRRLSIERERRDAPVRLRLTYRLASIGRLEAGSRVEVEVPRIQIRTRGLEGPVRAEIASAPGIDLFADGPGWRAPREQRRVLSPTEEEEWPIRLIWTEVGAEEAPARPRFQAVAPLEASLPAVVVSRLWVRDEYRPEGDVWSTAWYRLESHAGRFAFRIPPGSELIDVALEGAPNAMDRLSRLEAPDTYELRLPEAFDDEAVVAVVNYHVEASDRSGAQEPPRLVGDGRVLQTFWEIRMPWSRALVGVPPGYGDENRWYWGGYVWKRAPRLTAAELGRWLTGAALGDDLELPSLEDRRAGNHAYLFSRIGDPGAMRPFIASRALLVAACSGAVLVLGLIPLTWPSRPRWVVPVTVFVCGFGLALVGPSVALLVVQSSLCGALLVGLAGLGMRADRRRPPIEREHGTASVWETRSDRASPVSTPPSETVGSEAPTAIRRVPTPSTIDMPNRARPPESEVVEFPKSESKHESY